MRVRIGRDCDADAACPAARHLNITFESQESLPRVTPGPRRKALRSVPRPCLAALLAPHGELKRQVLRSRSANENRNDRNAETNYSLMNG